MFTVRIRLFKNVQNFFLRQGCTRVTITSYYIVCPFLCISVLRNYRQTVNRCIRLFICDIYKAATIVLSIFQYTYCYSNHFEVYTDCKRLLSIEYHSRTTNLLTISGCIQNLSTDNAHTMDNDINLSRIIVGNIITSGVNKFLFTFKAFTSFPAERKL